MNKPDLQTCTVQEACDYAVFKIVEQGKRCLNENKSCVYADEYGNHCSVGWLLDHEDDALMSSREPIPVLIRHKPYLVPELIIDNAFVFSKLQMFHDNAERYKREILKGYLSKYIDTSAPQYQKWVDMGEAV